MVYGRHRSTNQQHLQRRGDRHGEDGADQSLNRAADQEREDHTQCRQRYHAVHHQRHHGVGVDQLDQHEHDQHEDRILWADREAQQDLWDHADNAADHRNGCGESGEDAEDDGVGEMQQPAGDTDDDAQGETVDGDRAEETAHAESHLFEDVDHQLVVGFGEEVNRERLEPVAADQPEKPHHQHQKEVDDDAEYRSADGDEDVASGVDERA